MENQRLDELIEKYILKTATIQEQQELLDWYNTENGKEVAWLSEHLNEEVLVKKRMLLNINKRIQPKSVKLWPRIAAAAAILLVAGAGLFFYNSRPIVNRTSETVNQNDIAPGKIGATLTLANGKQITLSDAKNGELAKEAGVTITKDANGQLVYALSSSRENEGSLDHATSGDPSKVGMTNTLTTAKGETYQVRLPDGTLAWLNAASTLKYPASFTAHKNRRVELSGEAYFEVAKDKAHPFIVETSKQKVEVLGTHFNINGYPDEPNTETTLLEGSVRVVSLVAQQIVNRKSDIVTLLPNQQATLTDNTGITVKKVDANTAIDWKNGDFIFKEEPLSEIMARVGRWYDVDVSYASDVDKKQTFGGKVSRKRNISQVIKALQATQALKFRISGKHLYISN